jgi:hypothetical protein
VERGDALSRGGLGHAILSTVTQSTSHATYHYHWLESILFSHNLMTDYGMHCIHTILES